MQTDRQPTDDKDVDYSKDTYCHQNADYPQDTDCPKNADYPQDTDCPKDTDCSKSVGTQRRVRVLVRAAAIAALYTALTMLTIPISYGPFQFRVSEALTILPLFFPEAIVGLTVGCFISNIFGNGVLDLVFGTLATFVSATLTYLIGRGRLKEIPKIILAILPPILVNAIVVPFTFLKLTEMKEFYLFNVFTVGAGQLAVLVLLGIPLYYAIKKQKANLKAFN